ncbi:hsp90-like protein [Lasallia pustulata]|uniref:Hsp90-like protein n=1 Tax=Lasallia pustulata TaxID=136370 RepID=A0A1W5CZ23_9LECA|nr:hsp90-like protein [Lasallia pustulata]
MFNKANKGEHAGGIKTVRLARGPANIGSPSRTASTPGARLSMERPNIPRVPTPEDKEKTSSMQFLGQVGIIELLEQDERPTFIIDLGNSANFRPGPLQIAFANAALRGYSGLLDVISGKVQAFPVYAAMTTFPEFKAWSVSFVKNHECLDVILPSFIYGGISWTCSTLRKRLRLISGNLNFIPTSISSNTPSLATSMASNPPSADLMSATSLISEQCKTTPGIEVRRLSSLQGEPSDYFGDVTNLTPPEPSVNQGNEGVITTIEIPDEIDVVTRGHNERALLKGANIPVSQHESEDANPMQSSQEGFFDWTRIPLSPAMPRHIQFARSVDWASTRLGPLEEWSSDLRGMANMVMASPHPAAMYWGDDNVAIYNEAYILLAGQKHPQLMGQSYAEAWSEIWFAVKDVFASARLTGQATMKDDDCLFMKRSGFLEETYFSWSIIPLVGEDGSVVGLYNPAFEKTRRKIAERRMLTLREVGEKTAAARDVKGFWSQVLNGLEYNEYDTPFVLLYSVTEDPDSDASSVHSNSMISPRQCVLEGSLGVPDGHQAAPSQIDLKSGMDGFGPNFREAMKTDGPILLQTDNSTLPTELIEGIDWRGFGDPCRAAVVFSIHLTTSDSVLGFIVMGVNPRRPYDDDYDLFVQLLMRQLATSMASVVLFEEEIKRGQRAARLAALDRIELSEQLAARTQEAVESETKFTRMAGFAPVGMFIADSEGRITYCNDTWYEISRVPKEDRSTDNWMASVKDEDLERVKDLWTNLVQNTIPLNAEFRFKAPWVDRNGTRGDTWVLASAYPEKNEDGNLKSVFGSITNISQQKWAEDLQKRRMEEAVELKRQQENFIDITSHEMRNPLSAILQCADEISSSLTNFKLEQAASQPPTELVDSNIEAAQTIALCAQHQKRIVDDILTLSKLDSALLLVTPVDAQPVTVVQRALKMFEGELSTADIAMEFKVDESFRRLNIDWVRVDPSRLLQVLINLTTNAIKFTTTQAKRTIIVTLAASLERPSNNKESRVSYFPTRSKRKDLTEGSDWGEGEEVFLHFAVQDSGRGLSDDEKKLLFIRFSQASPRTHVQYGGSGLGLFISRELVELQGGEIGVASKSGIGSTFAFYVKARRSTRPSSEDALDHINVAEAAASRKSSQGLKSQKPVQSVAAIPTAPPRGQSFDNKGSLKVLVVEDNLVNQKVLSKQLRNLGCIVHVANHGGECIDFLQQSRFWFDHETDGSDLSVILMDLEMPVMDGLTCARKIRELQREGKIVRHVPIIAVTANARSEQIETALQSGMVSWFNRFET